MQRLRTAQELQISGAIQPLRATTRKEAHTVRAKRGRAKSESSGELSFPAESQLPLSKTSHSLRHGQRRLAIITQNRIKSNGQNRNN